MTLFPHQTNSLQQSMSTTVSSLPSPVSPVNKMKELKIDGKQQNEIDEILVPNDKRFTLFPIKYHDLWQMYKDGQTSNWVAEEIKSLEKDLEDWTKKLTSDERFYIEHILAFFAQADGIVNENLLLRFQQDVQFLEAQYFYQFQGMIENVHAEVYAMLIDVYVGDPEKKEYLFNAIDNVPCVRAKRRNGQ